MWSLFAYKHYISLRAVLESVGDKPLILVIHGVFRSIQMIFVFIPLGQSTEIIFFSLGLPLFLFPHEFSSHLLGSPTSVLSWHVQAILTCLFFIPLIILSSFGWFWNFFFLWRTSSIFLSICSRYLLHISPKPHLCSSHNISQHLATSHFWQHLTISRNTDINYVWKNIQETKK